MSTLPTLILGWGSQHRVADAQDNEQSVPGVLWADFPREFGLRRTFSANEIDFFDETSGRRSPFSRSSSTLHLKILEGAKKQRDLKRSGKALGISDEYVPGLVDFNPLKFGILPPLASPEEDKMSSTHAVVKPIAIEHQFPPPTENSGFQVTDEMFSIAKSPERHSDRIILSSLPKQFQSLSFSERRKLLNDIIPSSLKDDASYKDHISKIIRRNTSNTTSPNVSRRGSIVSRKSSSSKLVVEPNCNQMGSIILDSWVLGKVINRGAFGVIRECKHCTNLEDVKCFKLVNLRRSVTYLQRLKRELVTWAYISELDKQSNSNCTIQLLDFKITHDYMFMQMPLCNEGSLFDKVKIWESSRVTLRSRMKIVMKYIYHSARSIQFIHSNGLYHGDIKLENFILKDDKPLICDFGMADFIDKGSEFNSKSDLLTKIYNQCQCVINDLMNNQLNLNTTGSVPNFSSMRMLSSSFKQQTPVTAGSSNQLKDLNNPKFPDELIGSLPYASPELLKPSPKGISKPVDVWAFGVLCYALVMFKLPFSHSFEPRLKVMILDGNWRTKEWVHTIESVETGHLILLEMAELIDEIVFGCLKTDVKSRLTIDQVVEKLEPFANV